MSPLIKPSSNSVKGRKCCHQSALKRLASIMNEVRHPREVMCVLETNLICSRIGHSLSHQHTVSPTGLLYVVTSKRSLHFRIILPLSIMLTTVQIHFPCKAGNGLRMLVNSQEASGEMCPRVSRTERWNARERIKITFA